MPQREKRAQFAAFLNITFKILMILSGFWTNSLAILSDALHDFGDSIILFGSWLFERGSKKSPDSSWIFGYQRLPLFSAVISSSILIGGSFVIIFQVLPILLNSEEVNAFGMLGMAVIAIIFNGAGFFC